MRVTAPRASTITAVQPQHKATGRQCLLANAFVELCERQRNKSYCPYRQVLSTFVPRALN